MRPASLCCLLIAIVFLQSCQSTETENTYAIIPVPVKIESRTGHFQLKEDARIVIIGKTQRSAQVGRYLQRMLQPATGFEWPIENSPLAGDIVLKLDSRIEEEEGYELEITTDNVVIVAKQANGLFYGVQSLRQLLPSAIENEDVTETEWQAPCVFIEDYPSYSWRGMHLDVCRHFFPKEFIKKYIDLLAMHKMNKFHWHLTEDQGWRIEIKQYPKLQEIAAWRDSTLVGHYSDQPPTYDGERYGGYYTQDDVKEIVFYAAARFVEVIPEIEMPGHSTAALAAYPELGCTPGPFQTATTWGVFEDVYCPKEETFTFLENVLSEVFTLFPSKYIHIGGDECPKVRWENSSFCQDLMAREGIADEHELQSYFIRRMEGFINANGKQLIGWDEILEGGLAPNATVMSWRGTEGGIAAAQQGHDVIMTPTSNCYLDYYQAAPEGEPLAIGGYLPVDSVYAYEPTPAVLTEEEAKYILGAQGNVWTEYIPTPEHAEYMAFPRGIALSEVTWSQASAKDYENFRLRFQSHAERLDVIGVNYAKHILEE